MPDAVTLQETPLPLTALLGAAGAHALVSLVGAGGKTTLLFALAHLLVAAGEQVICTTTTHLFPPTPEQCPHVLLLEDRDDSTAGDDGSSLASVEQKTLVATLKNRLDATPLLTLAHSRLASGKLRGLAPDSVARLAQAMPQVRFLVEADGAARRPLKAPAAHEPVVPPTTAVCIAVIGLDCLDTPLKATTVHRLERVLAVTGQQAGSHITPRTLIRLVAHPEGLFQHCPPCRRVVFCNQAEQEARRTQLHRALSLPETKATPHDLWFAGSAQAGWCVPLSQA